MIRSVMLTAADPSATPASTVGIGAMAVILLVVALVALGMLMLLVALMNRRRHAARLGERKPGADTPDPWTLAGQRLDPKAWQDQDRS